ncbi:hypothetical protein GCM10010517_00790 [Streptosporangium fragile]|uniref:Uncharacterized protein n=1 Tax=Streptosporangium fragile TaxID=46186 RepID=A0ABN3VNM7_9ACTN
MIRFDGGMVSTLGPSSAATDAFLAASAVLLTRSASTMARTPCDVASAPAPRINAKATSVVRVTRLLIERGRRSLGTFPPEKRL